MSILPVIMCGGAGSRLWPRSRAARPKQFLPLVEESSLLAATAARLGHAGAHLELLAPVIICGDGQEGLVSADMASAGAAPQRIWIEPFGRNTAAVAAIAALEASALAPDTLVLLMPADHHIAGPDAFWQAIGSGLPAAKDGYLVTLGMEPDGPETGYGYVQRGAEIGPGVHAVANFKEKPDAATAAAYLASGDYFWNAGIFLFRADTMIAAFEAHAPAILAACRAAVGAARQDAGGARLDPEAFAPCPSEPVDVAIMEKADRKAVIAPVRAGWSDVGSWDAIAALKDGGVTDEDHVLALDCSNCLIESDGPFIAAIGLKDLVVIATGDSVLIMQRGEAQQVKTIVETLKKRGRRDLL
jgi:mannose-1-phosphate guanylyltransferase